VRWGIRNQILWPFALVLLAAVVLTALSAAWLAAERSEAEIGARLNRVMRTVGRSSFPYRDNVLELMQGLSGAEFVVVDAAGKQTATTLSPRPHVELLKDIDVTTGPSTSTLAERPVVDIDERRYFAAGHRRIGPRGTADTLYVLFPEEQLHAARREAAWPPIVVGGITVLALVMVSAWLAGRFGRRIRRVQQQVARIAGGDFQEMPLGDTQDEIQELVRSVNEMSGQLRDLHHAMQRTERTRLLGQLAGGLAHQLRNAVTGARLAVQLHQRRCSVKDGESLDVALRQLTMTEEHIKGLLSLGKPGRRTAVPQDLSDILNDVTTLVSPLIRHERVALSQLGDSAQGVTMPDSESVRTAVLNLVLNAVEAAGPEGSISIGVNRLADRTANGNEEEHAGTERAHVAIEVSDDGPGPPDDLQDALFEPFITAKAEGIGLGLALVKQVADELQGNIEWHREDTHTIFRLTLPVQSSPSAAMTNMRSLV